jgi:carbonic anhydrase
LVPQFDESKRNESVSAENAALELACYHNDVRTGVVCGHSDCKVSLSNLVMLELKEQNVIFQ